MNTNFYKLVLAGMVIMGLSSLSYGQELPSLLELERAERPKLLGAKVSNGDDASRIAMKAYAEKVRGLSAYEGSGQPILIELGFELKGFAKVGDKVWEVRFTNLNPEGNRSLRAILWVHAATEKVYFVCGPWGAEEKHEEKK
jgi:hypothetical protein